MSSTCLNTFYWFDSIIPLINFNKIIFTVVTEEMNPFLPSLDRQNKLRDFKVFKYIMQLPVEPKSRFLFLNLRTKLALFKNQSKISIFS